MAKTIAELRAEMAQQQKKQSEELLRLLQNTTINIWSSNLEYNEYDVYEQFVEMSGKKPIVHYIEHNEYLDRNILGYYSLNYYGWGKPDNPYFINTLKNDFNGNPADEIVTSCNTLITIATQHISEIIEQENLDCICIVPRAKAKSFYENSQLKFSQCISFIVDKLNAQGYDIENGVNYIERYINTKTTHFHNKPEYSGDGEYPYKGITKDTCHISNNIKGKSILLIDDIYTKSINIDEDCIQAILDYGANKVILYTIAKTYYFR